MTGDDYLFEIDNIGSAFEGWVFCRKNLGAVSLELAVSDSNSNSIATIKGVNADLLRNDVGLVHNIFNCGFSISLIDVCKNNLSYPLSLELYVNSNSSNKILLTTKIIYVNPTSKELKGKDGYNFLINDSNKVASLFETGRECAKTDIDQIINTLYSLENYFSKKNINFKIIIAPEKSHILKFLYSNIPATDDRLAKQVNSLGLPFLFYPSQNILDLSEIEKKLFFYRNDSHISFLGIDWILRNFDFGFKYVRPRFELIQQVGDLNGLIEEAHICNTDDIDIIDNTEKIIDDKKKLRNSKIYFHNKNSGLGRKLLIIGTSTGRKFAYAMANSFSNIEMAWTTSFNVTQDEDFYSYTDIFVIFPEKIIYKETLLKIFIYNNK